MRSRDNRASIPRGSGCVPVLICAQGCSARDTCRKARRARHRNPCWKEHPPTTGARGGPWREISKKPTPEQSPTTPAAEEPSSFHWSLCCTRAYLTRTALQSRTGLLACLYAPPTPIAAGKRRVEEIFLVVERLPAEQPDGIPSVEATAGR